MTRVQRWCKLDPLTNRMSGDYLMVDGCDLGPFRDLVQAEYLRAKESHPENPAFYMRPMWYTGSPFADEILELAALTRMVRP